MSRPTYPIYLLSGSGIATERCALPLKARLNEATGLPMVDTP